MPTYRYILDKNTLLEFLGVAHVQLILEFDVERKRMHT